MSFTARAYEWVVIVAVMAALLIASGFADILPAGDAIRSAAVLIVLALSLVGIGLAIMQNQLAAAAVSTVLLLSIWGYLYMFASKYGQEFNPLAGGAYFAGTLAALFTVAFNHIRVRNTFRVLAWCMLGYAVVYLLVVAALQFGLVQPRLGMTLFVASDQSSGRSARVAMAITFVTLGLGLGLARFVERKHLGSIAIVVGCLAAIWFSQSRMIAAITVAVCAAYFLLRNVKLLSFFAAAVYGAIVVGSLVMAFGDWNPWALMTRDISSRTRAQSTMIVQANIDSVWLTGTGFPSGPNGFLALSNNKVFYPADIGLTGVLFQNGVLGIIVYSAVALCGCFAWVGLKRLNASGDVANGVSICGIVLALYSFQAPAYLGGTAAIFGSIVMAIMLAAFPITKGITVSKRKRRA